MQRFLFLLPAMVLAGAAAAEGRRAEVLDPKAKAPPVQYRSAFEGYRPYADQDLASWRGANAEVGAARGHAGHLGGRK
jgi:hypothetical protein